jgi:flagellar motor switch/type III secretory pathway protein FliN
MATTPTMPAQASAPPKSAPAQAHDAVKAPEAAAEKALVRSSGPPVEEAAVKLAAPLARLPVELDVIVPVRDFRVRNLLALESGQIVESRWGHGDDVPLAAGNVTVAWCEFEVIDNQLAVRITRLV